MLDWYSSSPHAALWSIAAVFLSKRPLGRAILITTCPLQKLDYFIYCLSICLNGLYLINQRKQRSFALHSKYPVRLLPVEVNFRDKAGFTQAVRRFKGFFNSF